jgi:serine/threonine-protein kinase
VILESGTFVGNYRLEGMLGRGGMATVYRARHVELGREVALKVISGELGTDPEFVARFRREGRVQASLEHPHVVTVYEAGESEHGLYLAMRLVPGPTLAELIHERALDATRALALLHQVGEALDAAHAAGLVHRDVKPQNVLVGDSGDAYLGDFGLTRGGGTAGVTATGKLLGTISFLAPEVIRGGEATPASDLYAFAAIVFECLTGTVVYPRRTEAAVLYAHTSEPPPRISERRPELPPTLDETFVLALSKDPDERSTSAVELVETVSAALDEAGLDSLGPPPPPGATALDSTAAEPPMHPRRGARRGRRAVLWLVLACLLSAAVGAAIGVAAKDGDASQAAVIPAPLPEAQLLGSDLEQPGRTLDCSGRTPRLSSPSCTVLQAELPGATLVAPDDGVVRRWAVRSARGELALAVVRPKTDGFLQVARSRNEFVGNDGVHVFEANVAVERGDLLGLVLIPGSGVGARAGVGGATTMLWSPYLCCGPHTPDRGPGTGFDHELLLRVEYVAGDPQLLPHQVTGAAALELEPGRVRARRKLRFTNGRPVEIVLVAVGERLVLDQFLGGRRTARIDVPGFRARGGRIILFDVGATGDPEDLYINVQYANEESARVLKHYYAAGPYEFQFVD